MLDYLTAQRITPRHIYREIVTHIQAQPGAFSPLIQLELFVDVHAVPAGTDPDPEAPRTRICRHCASEVFLYGLRDWFLRERQKGFLEESVLSRKDCEDGAECSRQRDLAHAREFNHMIPNTPPAQTEGPASAGQERFVDFDIDTPSPMPEVSPALSGANTPDQADGTSSVPIVSNNSPIMDVPVIHDTTNESNQA